MEPPRSLASTRLHSPPLASTRLHSPPLASTRLHLAPFGSIWLHLAPFGSIWLHLAPCGSIWLHLTQKNIQIPRHTRTKRTSSLKLPYFYTQKPFLSEKSFHIPLLTRTTNNTTIDNTDT